MNDELKKKIAALPAEEPDELDLQMLADAQKENDENDGIDFEEYFEQRKSNTVSLRIPRTLRKQLQEHAQDEGVSLNQYCMYLLASGVNATARAKRN